MIEKAHAYFGATMLHAWGMTEMSPLGTCGSLLARHVDLDLEQRISVHLKQGRTVYGAEVRIVDDAGHELPRDGRSWARSRCADRGCCRATSRAPAARWWTTTAGSAPATSRTWTPTASFTITDRAKDVIKSGGEWISSIEIENLAVSHPACWRPR